MQSAILQARRNKKRLKLPEGGSAVFMFSGLENQSDYFFALAAGFFATGALVALAAPVFAFVDLAAFAGLAAPVFALVDFAAAGAGLAAAVFAFVDFAAVVFAGVLFAAITNFLREDSVTPIKFAGWSPVSGTNNREYFRLRWGRMDSPVTTCLGL
jgi:hypothetical protein